MMLQHVMVPQHLNSDVPVQTLLTCFADSVYPSYKFYALYFLSINGDVRMQKKDKQLLTVAFAPALRGG